jgi:hypothetical protein
MTAILADHAAWLARGRTGAGRASLVGADLVGASLTGASLSEADLRRASLVGADLDGANLRGANLSEADLTRASLSGADLDGANLTGADLRGAFLAGANLDGADLRGANLDGAIGIATAAEEAVTWAAVVAAVRAEPDRLDMQDWHGAGWDPAAVGACGTTHCLAGWAQALSNDPEVRWMVPAIAGSRLLPRHARWFYRSNDAVRRMIAEEP